MGDNLPSPAIIRPRCRAEPPTPPVLPWFARDGVDPLAPPHRLAHSGWPAAEATTTMPFAGRTAWWPGHPRPSG